MGKQIAQVRCPAGFSFKINDRSKNYVFVQLLDKKKRNKKVGEVRLIHDGDGVYETHSDLDPEYRDRGLGAKLYARAIQWCLRKGYRVKSSGASSTMAKRVWTGKTIRKYFRIIKRPYKPNPNPTWDTWHAYAK